MNDKIINRVSKAITVLLSEACGNDHAHASEAEADAVDEHMTELTNHVLIEITDFLNKKCETLKDKVTTSKSITVQKVAASVAKNIDLSMSQTDLDISSTLLNAKNVVHSLEIMFSSKKLSSLNKADVLACLSQLKSFLDLSV